MPTSFATASCVFPQSFRASIIRTFLNLRPSFCITVR
nr:MAG TPA: hypothetical protein [Caudoviricetes sp.]